MKKTKPIHIALFLPSLDAGGAQRITLSLALGLLQMGGVKVDIVLGQAKGPFLRDIPKGVRLLDLGQSRMLKTIIPLARYLRSERPDAIISALDYANVAMVVASKLSGVGVKTAVVTHVHLSSSWARYGLLKKTVFCFLMRKTYVHADAVITVSHGVAHDMAQQLRLPVSSIRVIFNPVIGVDMPDRANEPPNHPWLIDAKKPVILAVGRLSVEKDFTTLIEAVALLRKQTEVRLIILGEGEKRSELEALIARLNLKDAVDLPGFVANPCGFMRHSTVVALSSRWEALPTVLIEALYCGTRIVSTDCPSGPSEILNHGQYGRLVRVADPAAMAMALAKAVTDTQPLPSSESWKPFIIETAVRDYLDALGMGKSGDDS